MTEPLNHQAALVYVMVAMSSVERAMTDFQQVLQLVREALPERLRETAYWVALEVAAADRLTRPEEIRFLNTLGDALELNRSTTAAIGGVSAPVI
jgi:hypothetical protein